MRPAPPHKDKAPRTFLERSEMTMCFGVGDAGRVPRTERARLKRSMPAGLRVAIQVGGAVYENLPDESLHADIYTRLLDDPRTPLEQRSQLSKHKFESGFTVPTALLPEGAFTAVDFSRGQTATPCQKCPFSRTARPGDLGGVTADEWLAHTAQTTVLCHLHAWERTACAGSAIFRANSRWQPPSTRTAQLPPDHAVCWRDEQEFRVHHFVVTESDSPEKPD